MTFSSSEPRWCALRILIIEDDRSTAKLLRIVLEEQAYTVDVAHAGEQGKTLAMINEYDGVVLDLNLTDTHGLVILQDLRAAGVSTPVLILTGNNDDAVIARALDTGADDYVIKPISNRVFLSRVRVLLRRRNEGSRTAVLALGNVVLNRLTREILADGAAIKLTAREFGLMEVLMLRSGEPVTRTALIESLWGDNYDPGSNVVDAHVNRVRRKLEITTANLEIETLRAIGYRLRETS